MVSITPNNGNLLRPALLGGSVTKLPLDNSLVEKAAPLILLAAKEQGIPIRNEM